MPRAKQSNMGALHYLADAELNRFLCVTKGTDDDHVKYPTAVTDIPLGITVEGTHAAEQGVEVALFGRGETKVAKMAATTGSRGAWLTPSVDGTGTLRAVPTTAGAYWVVGRAAEDWTSGQEISVDDCHPFVGGAQHANGQLSIPSYATDPTTPSANQFWVNSTDNSLCAYINGAKRTISFVSALFVAALLALMLLIALSSNASAADKTPMVLGSATTGQIAAAGGSDNVKVPGTLEVVGNSTLGGNLAVTGTVTAAGYVSRITQTVAIADFTDGTGTSGYVDLTTQLPAGSLVLGWRAVVTGAFAGDTTAVMEVGKAGATSAYSTTTNGSCFTTGTIGSASVLATSFAAAATSVRVTVTGGADFTSIVTDAGGEATITVFYAY